jgi:hypothetical protein
VQLVEGEYLLDANKFSRYLTASGCVLFLQRRDARHSRFWMEGGLLGLKKAAGNNAAAQSAALASQRLASIAAERRSDYNEHERQRKENEGLYDPARDGPTPFVAAGSSLVGVGTEE